MPRSGGVTSGASVVKVQVYTLASALPAISLTSVVTRAVYTVFKVRLVSGSKTAVYVLALYVTANVTGLFPGPKSSNEAGTIVSASIASSKLTERLLETTTPDAPPTGTTEVTAGGVISGGGAVSSKIRS